ncbi:hypothetical protein [Bacillus safensis]|uniref:hypothetical protein n=1 Tax=Bacillus safensis TaxID=561879 RepID=UPI002E2B815C|nr:hypothetical protein [Bacillus safensis]MED5221757.1 hypothetical protein [Bacillus safensis]
MKHNIWMSLLMMILAIFLCACQSVQYSQSKPPSAEELLAMDQQADLFNGKERSMKQM